MLCNNQRLLTVLRAFFIRRIIPVAVLLAYKERADDLRPLYSYVEAA
jgi:hypothetical protein